MQSYAADFVIENETNMDIWRDRVWINHEDKTFFIPIWRNGSTEFMHAASNFGYVLDRSSTISDNYVGFAFVRDPDRRIAGQMWRAMTNQNWDIEHCIDNMTTHVDVEPHLLSQSSFLQSFDVRYLVDLDNIKNWYTGNFNIDQILFYMAKLQTRRSKNKEFHVKLDQYMNTIREVYREDYTMYDAVCRTKQKYSIVLREAKTCRVCGGPISELYDFGEIHINDFPTTPGHTKGKSPLVLDECKSCDLVQLRHTVNPEILYSGEYWYKSGANPVIRENLIDISSIVNVLSETGDSILDIGANDGTLLSRVHDDRVRFGCEPAPNMLDELSKHADVILNGMWDEVDVPDIKFKVITAIGMLYDLDNPNVFVRKVKDTLSNDGVFISQLMTLSPMLKNNDLGNICHEHLEYYSYKSLVTLFENNGLEIFRVVENNIQGGSYQIFSRHYATGSIPFVEDISNKDAYFENIRENGKKIRQLLLDYKENGKRCYVYGASTKGNTLLQIWGLDASIFDGAAEISHGKIGRYTVGSDIPIIYENVARNDADVFFVPNYGFMNMFLEKENEWILGGGSMVFAMPEVIIKCG